jgi:aminodeoxyfutalosine synthase
MAGSEEQNPAMTTAQLVALIKQAKRAPIERGTLYNVIKDYSTIEVAENEA